MEVPWKIFKVFFSLLCVPLEKSSQVTDNQIGEKGGDFVVYLKTSLFEANIGYCRLFLRTAVPYLVRRGKEIFLPLAYLVCLLQFDLSGQLTDCCHFKADVL